MRIGIDITGRKFGRLTAIEKMKDGKHKWKWKCQCECGNIIYTDSTFLIRGNVSSCGCKMYEKRPKKDLVGQKFNRLTVVEYLGNSKWLCKCDCGKEKKCKTSDLKNNLVKSCGCLKDEVERYKNYNKTKTGKALYWVWNGMKQRCYDENSSNYRLYGGKGIKICDEWKNDFIAFYNWAIENGYEHIEENRKNQLQIDRIDSSKNYCPENCRWITCSENSSRTSKTNAELEELLKQSSDELVKQYIERKMENNLEIQKEKKAIRGGYFPVRKNVYCYLKNKENTKQFLFKNFKTVGLFLNIKYSQVYYRVNKKDGIINEDWNLNKITKEEFDELSNNVEVIV